MLLALREIDPTCRVIKFTEDDSARVTKFEEASVECHTCTAKPDVLMDGKWYCFGCAYNKAN